LHRKKNQKSQLWIICSIVILGILTITFSLNESFAISSTSTEIPVGDPSIPINQDVVADSAGNIYSSTGTGQVVKFDSAGNVLYVIGQRGTADGEFFHARGLAVDSSDNLYVASYGQSTDRISKFDSTGNFLFKFGVRGVGPSDFQNPSAIAVTSTGNILVMNDFLDTIAIFDSTGTFLSSFGGKCDTNTGTGCDTSAPGAIVAGDGQFNDPFEFNVDSSDNIYVVDSRNERVQVFDSTGSFLFKFGSQGSGAGQFVFPFSVSVDPTSGNIVVTDNDPKIQVYDSSGSFLFDFGGGTGIADGKLNQPADIFINSSGEIYIADTGNNRIQIFDSAGTHLQSIGKRSLADAHFNEPLGVDVDSSGNIYVADFRNHRIQVLDSDGNLIFKKGAVFNGEPFASSSDGFFNFLKDVAVEESTGDIIVADDGNNRLQRLDSTGAFISKVAFTRPLSVAVDNNSGNIIASETFGAIFRIYDSSFTLLTSVGGTSCLISSGSGCNTSAPGAIVAGDGQFAGQIGLDVDNSGNIYAADVLNHRVQVFDSAGSFLFKFGSLGTADGQLSTPVSIAVDDFGNVFVAERQGERVSIFDSSGQFIGKLGSFGVRVGEVFEPQGIAVHNSAVSIILADSRNDRIQIFEVSDFPPIAKDDSLGAFKNTSTILEPLLNDSDPDGDPLSITSIDTTGTQGAVVNNGDGTVTITPTINFEGLTSFDYTIFDGINTDTATVTVNVLPVTDIVPVEIQTPVLNSEQFGSRVALDGPHLVISGLITDQSATGNVYIYDQSGVQQHVLPNPTPNTDDQFGFSVTVDGNLVGVGAIRDDTANTDSGAVYLYDATTGSPPLLTITNPNAGQNEAFGYDIAIDGTNVLVGAPQDDTGAANSGVAYLFDTAGTQLLKFVNPTPAVQDDFGRDVDISGTKVVIGADFDDTAATNAGAAYIFDTLTCDNDTSNGGTAGDGICEAAQHSIVNPNVSGTGFGWEVGIDGNNVVIGSANPIDGATFAGVAFVYDATTGNLIHTIPNPAPGNADRFSQSLSISGNQIIIGATFDDTSVTSSGAAFEYDATTGLLVTTFLSPNPTANGLFGTGVGAGSALIGSSGDNTGGVDVGAAYFFATAVVAPPIVTLPITWDGGATGVWSVASNWSGGVTPAGGDIIIIDESVTVTLDIPFILTTGTLTIEDGSELIVGAGGSLTNDSTNTVIINGLVTITTTLTNSATGTIEVTSTGDLQISSTGTLSNSGIINNAGLIYNNSGGDFVNDGTVNIQGSGSITNDSTLTNNGTLSLVGDLTNGATGILDNNNLINIHANIPATLTNDGTFTNNGTIQNNGAFLVNNNLLTNNGDLNNNSAGTINNNGTIDNQSVILNQFFAVFNNNGTITNDATINNNDADFNNGNVAGTLPGTINNSGTINNQTIDTAISTITNNLNSNINNSSTINNTGTGTIDNTNGTITNDCTGVVNGSISGNAVVDGCPPIAANISPASFDEDVESIITLSYSDGNGDLATSATISALSNVTVTTPVACTVGGVCTVGVTGTGDFNGSAGFSYTVTAGGTTSNSATATLTIDPIADTPVADDLTPASFDEDVESIITLSYSDADGDLATAASISSPTNITETTPGLCCRSMYSWSNWNR